MSPGIFKIFTEHASEGSSIIHQFLNLNDEPGINTVVGLDNRITRGRTPCRPALHLLLGNVRDPCSAQA